VISLLDPGISGEFPVNCCELFDQALLRPPSRFPLIDVFQQQSLELFWIFAGYDDAVSR